MLLHCVTCSFIIMKTHTHAVVYLNSIPRTPSCCPKYSVEHQIWINPPLKIVPKQMQSSLMLEGHLFKNYSYCRKRLRCEDETMYLCFSRCTSLEGTSGFELSDRQTEQRSQKILTHCWFGHEQGIY